MLEPLDALTNRVNELVALVRHLREENHQLRTQVANAQAEAGALRERIAVASQRLDTLLEQLPQSDDA
ncbi:uncharacterized protein E1O_00860 [Burkholderiales bacterium GJ-E10]|nr:uncharacterized protein E1O_00860 [Burkholderiales bacterium GJ-E10]